MGEPKNMSTWFVDGPKDDALKMGKGQQYLKHTRPLVGDLWENLILTMLYV